MEPALAVYVLFGLVALRIIIVGVGAALLLRAVRSCPACLADSTFPSHRPRLRLIAPWMEWRFCPLCGWQGPSRRLGPRDAPLAGGHEAQVVRDASRRHPH